MGYTHQGIGYQSTDTSKFAAKSNTELKISIRDQVLKLLTEADVAMSAEISLDRSKLFLFCHHLKLWLCC